MPLHTSTYQRYSILLRRYTYNAPPDLQISRFCGVYRASRAPRSSMSTRLQRASRAPSLHVCTLTARLYPSFQPVSSAPYQFVATPVEHSSRAVSLRTDCRSPYFSERKLTARLQITRIVQLASRVPDLFYLKPCRKPSSLHICIVATPSARLQSPDLFYLKPYTAPENSGDVKKSI